MARVLPKETAQYACEITSFSSASDQTDFIEVGEYGEVIAHVWCDTAGKFAGSIEMFGSNDEAGNGAVRIGPAEYVPAGMDITVSGDTRIDMECSGSSGPCSVVLAYRLLPRFVQFQFGASAGTSGFYRVVLLGR
jgi:hypothetical protein